MKRIILLLAMLATFTVSKAQSVFTPVADTNTNSTTRYILTPLMPSSIGCLTFQYVGTKVSGTVSGTVLLQGSVDGTNYTTITDTLTLADVATNTKIWDVTDKKRLKWRFAVTTSGTLRIANKGYFTERK